MIIKAGTIINLTYGIYSDKVYDGPFLVLKDLDQFKVSQDYISDWKRGAVEHDYWFDTDDPPRPETFPAWLTREGYIEDVKNSATWFTGAYDFDPEVIPDEPEQDHP